ncbi:hypothetical protein [Mucilaginibacter sp. UYCu711]|uniref:hypothetical protein n=1 Tax=Mucilaginibacter sp. UYCu711 TaxID=3156339 RepID=UPI003D223C14
MLSRTFIYLLGFVVISLQCSCDFNLIDDVGFKEIKRTQSPDHKVDAILIEADAGATTSTSGKVFITKSGNKITSEDFPSAIFNCDNFSGLDVSWKATKELTISYLRARIFNYSSKWKSDDGKYGVNVSLDSLNKR